MAVGGRVRFTGCHVLYEAENCCHLHLFLNYFPFSILLTLSFWFFLSIYLFSFFLSFFFLYLFFFFLSFLLCIYSWFNIHILYPNHVLLWNKVPWRMRYFQYISGDSLWRIKDKIVWNSNNIVENVEQSDISLIKRYLRKKVRCYPFDS